MFAEHDLRALVAAPSRTVNLQSKQVSFRISCVYDGRAAHTSPRQHGVYTAASSPFVDALIHLTLHSQLQNRATEMDMMDLGVGILLTYFDKYVAL